MLNRYACVSCIECCTHTCTVYVILAAGLVPKDGFPAKQFVAKAKLAVQTVREGFDAFARDALLPGAAEVAAADGDWAKKVAASKYCLLDNHKIGQI